MFSLARHPEKKSPFYSHYSQLREIGKRLSEEIPNTYDLDKAIPAIVRVLGIGNGKNIMMESEEEINFFIDFLLHEYEEKGQTLLERYRADHLEADSLTVEYLDAGKNSYTSLFKVIATQPEEMSIILSDLLNPADETLTVLNINLSKTAVPGGVIFSRLLPFAEFNGFSGMFAAFESGGDGGAFQGNRALLKRYKIMKKRIKSDRDSVQRFVACFKIQRVIGIESRTA
jgi:hypothetical protein